MKEIGNSSKKVQICNKYTQNDQVYATDVGAGDSAIR